MMNKKLAIAAAVLATMGGYSVYAEDVPMYTLDAVVVTATRTPEKAIDANANVDVVTAKDIETHHYQNVLDAVRKVPGVTIAGHSANGQSTMSDQVIINGSSNVVVMIDGMRINTNGNTLSNSDMGVLINLSTVDRIEVLKGSASTLYGSDAQGGVINIITKKPEDGTMKTKVGAAFSSYDGEKYKFYHEGAENGFFWTVDAQKQLQNDYKDGWGRNAVNHLNAKTYGIKLGKELGNDSDITLQYWKYKSDYQRPVNGTNDSNRANGAKDDDRLSIQYKAKLSDKMMNQFSIYRNNNHIRDYMNGSDYDKVDMKLRTTGISDQLSYVAGNQVLTAGIDWYKDEIPYYFGDASINGKDITNSAFYIQDKLNVNEKWNVTPGIRVDHHSEFGTRTSPSLSIGYKANEQTNYYVSYKEFFSAPNMYQLYFHSQYGEGNRNLKPEEGYTMEAGVNHEFNDTLNASVSVYHQHAKNLIGWVTTNPVTYYGTYENSGESDLNGVNVSLNKTFDDHVSTYLGYSYVNADVKNDVLSYLPKHKISVSLDYKNSNYSLFLSGIGIMDRYAKGVMKDYSSFWVWNLGANYQVTPNAEVYARVNNLFDQFYTDIGGIYNSPNGTWYSAPGRNYEVGVSFQF